MAVTKSPFPARDDQATIIDLWSLADKPVDYAIYAYPWGKKDTPLWNKKLRTWQRDLLEEIQDHIVSNRLRMELDLTPKLFQKAISSGHGTGKSTIVSILAGWMESCHPGASTIISANTEAQLRSRTFAEITKWNTMAINSHWWEVSGLLVKPAPWYAEKLKSQLKIDTGFYYCQGQLWSEENEDAYAGIHNQEGTLLVFDEASGIPDNIWRVSGGFFTDPVLHRYWLAFSQCRRTTGQFYKCLKQERELWRRQHLDSRDVEGTDKEYLDTLMAKGPDSYEARVMVKGLEPLEDTDQFISQSVIDIAAGEPWTQIDEIGNSYAPLILSVDPARFGRDRTAFVYRRGRDARTIPVVTVQGMDNVWIANRVMKEIEEKKPDAVAVDTIGVGAGVFDILKDRGVRVFEVVFSRAAENDKRYDDRRTELWDIAKAWLGAGGRIHDSQELKEDLAGPRYFITKEGRLKLESKESMKKRGLASPDTADALVGTFEPKVLPRSHPLVNARYMVNKNQPIIAKGVARSVFVR